MRTVSLAEMELGVERLSFVFRCPRLVSASRRQQHSARSSTVGQSTSGQSSARLGLQLQHRSGSDKQQLPRCLSATHGHAASLLQAWPSVLVRNVTTRLKPWAQRARPTLSQYFRPEALPGVVWFSNMIWRSTNCPWL